MSRSQNRFRLPTHTEMEAATIMSVRTCLPTEPAFKEILIRNVVEIMGLRNQADRRNVASLLQAALTIVPTGLMPPPLGMTRH